MARGGASMHVQTHARVRVQLRAYVLACGFQGRSRDCAARCALVHVRCVRRRAPTRHCVIVCPVRPRDSPQPAIRCMPCHGSTFGRRVRVRVRTALRCRRELLLGPFP